MLSLYVKRKLLPEALFISNCLSGPVVPIPTLPELIILNPSAPLLDNTKAPASAPCVAFVNIPAIDPANSEEPLVSSV